MDVIKVTKSQRIIANIFALIILLTLATRASSIELEYWVPFSGGDARPMKSMVDEFNQSNPRIKILMKVIRWDEYYPALNEALLSGQKPDIAVIHASALMPYFDKDHLSDLSSIFEELQLSSSFPLILLDKIQFDKKFYALPIDSHPLVLYFNKSLLKQAGLLDKYGLPLLKEGADNFVEFLTTLKARLPENKIAFSTPNHGILPLWFWYSLFHQQTDSPEHIQTDMAAINNQYGRNVFNFFKTLRDNNLWTGLIHDEKGYNLFKNGSAALMITGVWANWSFKQNQSLDFGVINFPRFFDKAANFGDSHTLVITRQNDADKLNAAKSFISWVSENNLKWALSGQVPANTKVNQSAAYQEYDNADIFLKAVDNIVYFPKHPKLKASNQAIKNTIIRFLNSDMSTNDALYEAENAVNNVLQKK